MSPTKDQILEARPTRLVETELKSAGEGKWRVTVPLRPAKWAGWLLRVSAGASRTFELDVIGKTVWDACDGESSVRQIIRRLAEQYNLNGREAEVATVAFLNTLLRKGLIGMNGQPD